MTIMKRRVNCWNCPSKGKLLVPSWLTRTNGSEWLMNHPRQSLREAVPDSEVEFQEQLIQEREGEIAEIEQGITELNQIFRDLASIVTDQGSMISVSLTHIAPRTCP